MSSPFAHDPAPADARPHAPWPTWRKVLAYLLLAVAAAFGIWLVDVKSKLGESREHRDVHEHSVQAMRVAESFLLQTAR